MRLAKRLGFFRWGTIGNFSPFRPPRHVVRQGPPSEASQAHQRPIVGSSARSEHQRASTAYGPAICPPPIGLAPLALGASPVAHGREASSSRSLLNHPRTINERNIVVINRGCTAIPSYHAHSNGFVLIYNCASTLSWWVDTSFVACLMYGNHIILGLDNLAERMSSAQSSRKATPASARRDHPPLALPSALPLVRSRYSRRGGMDGIACDAVWRAEPRKGCSL